MRQRGEFNLSGSQPMNLLRALSRRQGRKKTKKEKKKKRENKEENIKETKRKRRGKKGSKTKKKEKNKRGKTKARETLTPSNQFTEVSNPYLSPQFLQARPGAGKRRRRRGGDREEVGRGK